MAATTTQMKVTSFPIDKEVEIKLKVRIATQDDLEYFFSENNSLQPGFLADIYDMLDMINKHIITINGMTYKDLQKQLNEE